MIYLPKVYGLCKGSENALKVVENIYNIEKEKRIYIFKEILHNEKILKDLNEKGIETIDNIDTVTKSDILIIRAHGETKELFEKLDKSGIQYYDATCPNVKKIHNIVQEKYIQGYTIILIGKKNHPETIGICGWCNNEAIVIQDEQDIDNIDLEKLNNIFIVTQTTISENRFIELSQMIKKRVKQCEVLNTVCNAQKMIQDSSYDLAKDMDIMIVIGGKSSSNTEELYKRCKEGTKSYKISSIEELYNIDIDKTNKKVKIGITGGASTPKEQIMEYKNVLESMYK